MTKKTRRKYSDEFKDEAKTCFEWGKMYLPRKRSSGREKAQKKFDHALKIFKKIGA